MEAITLSDLGPVIAAVLGPMLVFMATSMRYQHVDSTKTRELIEKSNKDNRELIDRNRELIDRNRELIEKSNKDNRELIEKSNKDTRELIVRNRELIEKSNKDNRELIVRNRELIEKNHAELRDSLGEARERLARIEGYLNVPPPPRHSPEDDADADAKAA